MRKNDSSLCVTRSNLICLSCLINENIQLNKITLQLALLPGKRGCGTVRAAQSDWLLGCEDQ